MSNANAPAYPVPGSQGRSNGLTKRELFAAMAMQGMLSNMDYYRSLPHPYGVIVKEAVETADELLAELEKGKEAK